MNIPEVCITFIAALLGVAYPILLEVASRLDDKYSSMVVVNLFKEENEWKLFRIFLGSSLIGVLIYIIINLPFLPFPIPQWLTYSFLSLFVISTVILIVNFLLFVKKIITYYSTHQVLQYFNRKKENEEHIYFQATSDILHLSIRKQDTVTAKTASEYIYKSFREIRAKNKGLPVLYPDAYYQMVYKTVQELIFSKDERFIYLEHRSLGGVWFLGEHEKAQIHELTFGWMWRALVLAIKHDRDDMVMQYWSVAHQHFIYELVGVNPNRVRVGDLFVVTNEDLVNKRDNERSRFIEFNYVLGGLLLYRNRYDAIRRMFRYTISVPQSYDLLPLWMNEVFELYFKFRDPYDYNFPFINHSYNFPNSEGIQAEGLVKYWICKYAALLFLRQYTIIPHLAFMEPLRQPIVPVKQSEKRLWIENLDYFKKLIIELLNDQELLKGVGIGFMNEQWFIDNEKTPPNQFIDVLKQNVTQAFEDTEQNQPISEGKKQAFIDKTKTLMKEALKPYRENLLKNIQGETKNWYVPSITMVAEKSAFSDNQDIHNTNFDSFLASRQADRIRKAVSETFHMKGTEAYLLRTNDLFAAIDNLSIDADLYIIINFGIDLSYHTQYTKIPGLSENKYKSFTITSFQGYNRALMNATLYILKKEDLPAIIFKDLSAEDKEKYSVEEIEDSFHLYASVIDLNTNNNIRTEVEAEGTYTHLNKSVLMYIGMNIEIRWKKDIRMLALSQYSEFSNRGVPNDLNDVKFS
ncbi:hypothetical protein HDE69_004292 [Pedobacter cryoconitis]|uniref:Uncharacterized protein n=1 Tax=Pedobacter cryoconitis TaxID=188932 RepID=A0A7W8YWQ9_9SPHI|nr:hypothetical protein [Pedobacter cryoconitis]MBB5623209.1 hypothetical protein [Pedobacter cryoconitis]